jgi:hypothetical protein
MLLLSLAYAPIFSDISLTKMETYFIKTKSQIEFMKGTKIPEEFPLVFKACLGKLVRNFIVPI